MGKRILCYGDSNTWGYIGGCGQRYPSDVRWTGRLQKMFPEYTIIEEGMNGRTTVFDDPLTPGCNGLTYLTPCLLSQAPLDMVIICIGTNDLKCVAGHKAGASAQGAGMLIAKTREILGKDIPILLISPVWIGYERKDQGPLWVLDESCYEQSRMFPFFFGAIATQYGCHFLDAQQFAEPGHTDAVHMDEANHAKFAEAVAEKIREILGNE